LEPEPEKEKKKERIRQVDDDYYDGDTDDGQTEVAQKPLMVTEEGITKSYSETLDLYRRFDIPMDTPDCLTPEESSLVSQLIEYDNRRPLVMALLALDIDPIQAELLYNLYLYDFIRLDDTQAGINQFVWTKEASWIFARIAASEYKAIQYLPITNPIVFTSLAIYFQQVFMPDFKAILSSQEGQAYLTAKENISRMFQTQTQAKEEIE
jgi:hypothetical protein